MQRYHFLKENITFGDAQEPGSLEHVCMEQDYVD